MDCSKTYLGLLLGGHPGGRGSIRGGLVGRSGAGSSGSRWHTTALVGVALALCRSSFQEGQGVYGGGGALGALGGGVAGLGGGMARAV